MDIPRMVVESRRGRLIVHEGLFNQAHILLTAGILRDPAKGVKGRNPAIAL